MKKRNNAPLPLPDEIFDRLSDARFFSRLNFDTAFHQIRINPEDEDEAAFNNKYCQFEELLMPMGLCNKPATFQTLMNRIFDDCIDVFRVVYIDDLLIHSRSREEFIKKIYLVLGHLRSEQLYVSPNKCSFMKKDTSFLGMVWS